MKQGWPWVGIGLGSAIALAAVMYILHLIIGLNWVYCVGVWFGTISVIVGILWRLYSSELLRRAWKLEAEAVKKENKQSRAELFRQARVLRDLRDVSISWSTAAFAFAALVFSLLVLFRSILAS